MATRSLPQPRLGRMRQIGGFALALGLAVCLAPVGADGEPAPAGGDPARLAIPDPASQAAAEKVVRSVFGNYAAAPAGERADTSGKMMTQAAESANDPVARYVLLKDAAELSAGIGDAATAMKAAGMIAKSYAMDTGQWKYELLRKAVSAATSPNAARAVAAAGLAAANEAAGVGNFDVAGKLLHQTETAARNTRSAPVLAAVQARSGDFRWMQSEAARAKTAEAKLARIPDDPDANLAVGRYLCLARGDWKAGLPALARATNPALRAAAQSDLANPQPPEKRAAAGDGWWALAEKELSVPQAALRQRAAYWYGLALADAQFAGLNRARVEKRLSTLNAIADNGGGLPAATFSANGASATGGRNVVLFVGNSKEEPIFRSISNGNIRVVRQNETAAFLAGPDPFANSSIIVWGRNCFCAVDVPSTAQETMRRFVEGGGDLVVFEQSPGGADAANRLKANWDFIEKQFGVKTRGAGEGATPASPEVGAWVRAAGLTDDFMKKVRFYNAYTLPKNGTELIHAGPNHDITVAAGVPYGNGRLIAIGTNLDPADEALDEVVLDFIYHYKRGKK